MSRVRTFVAIEIDAGIRRKAEQQIAQLEATRADVKWVDAQRMHLTLKFLGYVDDVDLAGICRVVDQAAEKTPPFSIACRGMGAFPNAQRPRIIWLGLDEPTGNLQRLQQELENHFQQMGFPAEDRRFVPHLTLGRVRAPGGELAEVTRHLEANAQREWGVFPVEEVVVFSSQLSPQGPTYTPLSHAPLG
jgi:2'-5' RNA ligase